LPKFDSGLQRKCSVLASIVMEYAMQILALLLRSPDACSLTLLALQRSLSLHSSQFTSDCPRLFTTSTRVNDMCTEPRSNAAR
jgi:hypothetical protein